MQMDPRDGASRPLDHRVACRNGWLTELLLSWLMTQLFDLCLMLLFYVSWHRLLSGIGEGAYFCQQQEPCSESNYICSSTGLYLSWSLGKNMKLSANVRTWIGQLMAFWFWRSGLNSLHAVTSQGNHRQQISPLVRKSRSLLAGLYRWAKFDWWLESPMLRLSSSIAA